jgi:hypothetical protein
MGIFTDALSQDTIVSAIVVNQEQRINRGFRGFVARYIYEFKDVWYNDKATAQEIVEKMGTRALQTFTNSAITRDYILAIDPDAIPLDLRTPPIPFAPEIVDGEYTGRIILG